MNTSLRWLIVPAVLVGVGYFLRAQDTGEPRKTGKVLLLRTGLAMEGEIEQVGAQMCVRNGKGEVWIAADKTMRLSPDWLDAYAFMHTLIKVDSAGDRVKLARWCHLHHLNNEAMEQAKAALELQPENAEAKLIVTLLERARKDAAARPTAPTTAPLPAPVREVEPAPLVDVTVDTLIAFNAKVQPILMNTCASCHANESPTKFRLERVSEHSHKASTQRNLAAVLEQIDFDRPAISPLLVKSITPHGRELLPPLRDRSVKPFQAMQQWIGETIQKNPQLIDYRATKKPAPAKATPVEKPATFSAQGTVAPQTGGDVVSQATPRYEMTAVQTPTVPLTRAQTPATERDWCDAAWFNELPR